MIASHDYQYMNPGMLKAIFEEVCGILDHGTFHAVLTEDIPHDAILRPSRFVFLIKSTVDGSTRFKAPFVVGGHCDKVKKQIVHSSQTFHPISIRLLDLAAIHGFDVWTSDVKKAYLRSEQPLGSLGHIRSAPDKFESSKDQ